MIHKLVGIAKSRNHLHMKRTHPDMDNSDVEYIDEGRRVRLRPDYYIWKLPSLLKDIQNNRYVADMYPSGRRPRPLGQVLERSGSYFPWFGPPRRYYEVYYGGTFPISEQEGAMYLLDLWKRA